MRRTMMLVSVLSVACSSEVGPGDLIGEESQDPKEQSQSGTQPGSSRGKGSIGTPGADAALFEEEGDAAAGSDSDGGVVPKTDSGSTPPPPPPPVVSDCLASASISKLTGAFTSQYGGQPANGSTIDARGASWSMNDGWLSTPKASSNICWVGGEFSLSIDDSSVSPTDAWANIWHHDGGQTLKYNNSNWVFDSITIRHVGDAFNMSDGAQNFTVRHSHISDVRDDCVQNDDFHAGDIHDNFFEGCYAGFSARATAGVTPNDGHNNLWTIHDNVIWIKPMRSVYKGDSPGNAQLIKWEKTNPQLAPKLAFKNNVVRIGKTPFQVGGSGGEAFYFPPGIDFANNTLYWDGAGTAPASLVAMFDAAHGSKIVYTSAEWDAAVSKWKTAHPGVK